MKIGIQVHTVCRHIAAPKLTTIRMRVRCSKPRLPVFICTQPGMVKVVCLNNGPCIHASEEGVDLPLANPNNNKATPHPMRSTDISRDLPGSSVLTSPYSSTAR